MKDQNELPKTETTKASWELEVEAIERREAEGVEGGVSEKDLVW